MKFKNNLAEVVLYLSMIGLIKYLLFVIFILTDINFQQGEIIEFDAAKLTYQLILINSIPYLFALTSTLFIHKLTKKSYLKSLLNFFLGYLIFWILSNLNLSTIINSFQLRCIVFLIVNTALIVYLISHFNKNNCLK